MTIAAYLPVLEAAETLYGWCAHVHQISCNTSSARTSLGLFGRAHAMRHQEVPARVSLLERWIEGHETEGLIQHHTVAGAYLPFVASNTKQRILSGAAKCAPAWTRAALQVSRSRPIYHPLRLCPQCVESDAKAFGRPLWRTEHQLPGACYCLTHGVVLHHAYATGKRWLTPEAALKDSKPIQGDPAVGHALTAIAIRAATLTAVDVEALRRATQLRLLELGAVQSLKRGGREDLVAWFTSTSCSRLCSVEGTGLASLADGKWILGQLWKNRRTHAARWILLWGALQWASAPQARDTFAAACSPGPTAGTQQDLWQAYSRAPPPGLSLADALQVCDSYAQVMEQLGCCRSDLCRWLTNDPALRLAWRARLIRVKAKQVIRQLAADQTVEERRNAVTWLKTRQPELYALTGLPDRYQRRLF